jgi:8-oxo-dGTP pyrophosphatase MutT (NUDIX family)
MHVTTNALLVRGGTGILLVEHRGYGITVQPGGHVQPTDASLAAAALREPAEAGGRGLRQAMSDT